MNKYFVIKKVYSSNKTIGSALQKCMFINCAADFIFLNLNICSNKCCLSDNNLLNLLNLDYRVAAGAWRSLFSEKEFNIYIKPTVYCTMLANTIMPDMFYLSKVCAVLELQEGGSCFLTLFWKEGGPSWLILTLLLA